jgi:hypothetical protein
MELRGEWLGNRDSAQGRDCGRARDSFGKHRTEWHKLPARSSHFLVLGKCQVVKRRRVGAAPLQGNRRRLEKSELILRSVAVEMDADDLLPVKQRGR